MSNLLCVDWDYFFPNPMEAGEYSSDALLYDWSHRESEFFIDMVWGTRAHGFIMHDLPLPAVNDDWREFARRFKLAEDTRFYVADSNMHAGQITGEGDYEHVWLYDAHHDCGYGVKTYGDWFEKHNDNGSLNYSCEDWMLIHYLQGSELHWRFPTWHAGQIARAAKEESSWPEGVRLDAAVDDGSTPDVEFDVVFICRSGAWVPPWCDDDFGDFLMTWPGEVDQVDDANLRRELDLEAATEQGRMLRDMIAAASQREVG